MQRAAELGVDMPITREVHAVLFEDKPVAAGLVDLMRRDPAEELRGLDPRERYTQGGLGE
jgi:glycerol-3-phosphate dehydrogenase